VIETFLRPPVTPAQWAADAVRALGTVGVVAAGLGWGAVEFWVCALALLGVFASRFLGLRPALDIALGVSLVVAAWSSVLDLYAAVSGWDLVVHFATTGLLAAALVVMAERAGIVPPGVPRSARAVLTTAFGVTAAVVWEIAEWVGHNFVDPQIYVGYNDTVGDLLAGAAGSLLAGLTLRATDARSETPAREHARL
jgi:hypothetical protein